MKYKIKDCFELKKVADDYVVIPRGTSAIDFSAVAVFNETGALLFEKLKEFLTSDELCGILIEKYGIEKDLADKDVNAFLKKLECENMLDIEG